MHKKVSELSEFGKERYKESLKRSPEECDNYLKKFCCKDLDAARCWFCNNGNPSIEEHKNKKWKGCEDFKLAKVTV